MPNLAFTLLPANLLSWTYTIQDSDNTPVGRIEFSGAGIFSSFPANIYFKDDHYTIVKVPTWFCPKVVLLDQKQIDAGKSEEESLLATGTTPLLVPVYRRFEIILKPVDYESSNYGNYLLGENLNRFNVFTSYGGSVGENLGSLELLDPISKSVFMRIDSKVAIPIQLFFFVLCIPCLRDGTGGRYIPPEKSDELL